MFEKAKINYRFSVHLGRVRQLYLRLPARFLLGARVDHRMATEHFRRGMQGAISLPQDIPQVKIGNKKRSEKTVYRV
jgi:hypothetical protein